MLPLRRRQRGMALIIVLIALAVAGVIGMSLLESSAIRRISATTGPKITRAKYLAESALQHAMYLASASPETLSESSAASPLGPFQADDTSDTYTFYAVAMSDTEGHYVLHGTGTCDGVTQTASAEIQVNPPQRLTYQHALTAGVSNYLWTTVRVQGSVYATGNLWVYGPVTGDAYASGMIYSLSSPGYGVLGELHPYSSQTSIPWPATTDYADYTCDAGSGAWQEFQNVTVVAAGHAIDNKAALTASNPAGVVRLVPAAGTVYLGSNLSFDGTMIVEGDLAVLGSNITLKAEDGFPALIVTGAIRVGNGSSIAVKGMVFAKKGITNTTSGAFGVVTVKGGVVCRDAAYSVGITGLHIIQYDAAKCSLYDFRESADLPTLEVLRWLD